MKWVLAIFAAGGVVMALGAPARADVANDFSTYPLTDASVLVQGPDAANVNARFTYNSADHTLTAHYDSTLPTIKLVFPMGGQHFTQDTSFTMSTTFKILASGFVSPVDFGASAPAFGMINSATTGSARNSTGYYDSDFNFVEVTPGTSYDLMTFDYFPTQDNTYGGDSVDLTAIHSAQSGVPFDNSFSFGYASAALPRDQFITATLAYNAATHQTALDWGTGSLTADLTGAVFNVDSFAITLWQDTNLAPAAPAVSAGNPIGANVVFESFSVVDAPEPRSLALMAGALLLAFRGRRRGR